MNLINNITVKEYFNLKDSSEYDLFIDTLEAKPLFNGHKCNLKALSYDMVETIKLMFFTGLEDDLREIFIELFSLGSFEISPEDEFYNASIFDLFRSKKYIQDWLLNLIKIEKLQLSGESDEKMMMINAGERLKNVSHLLNKISLAEQFSTTPNEIGKMKYTTVFTILLANKLNADVTKDYIKLKM